MRALGIFAATALFVLALAARADESAIRLKDGAGRDLVLGYCSGCHSLDYVQGNSPFMNRATWEAEVNKMIKAYGAQIPAQDVPKVVDYLTTQYGGAPVPAK